MRYIFLMWTTVLLAACHNETGTPIPGSYGPKKNSKYAGILAKCKAITIDTLPVYSFEDDDDGVNPGKNYRYNGIEVDTAEAKLFPAVVAEAFLSGGGDISACYSFAIDNARTGIIARTPSMYESSSIKLFTLDNEQDTLTDFIELGELWGDAGSLQEKRSWLYRDDKMKLNAFMWLMESYDHSVEDENDTTVDRTNYYYVLNLSKPKYDTVNMDAGNLFKTFRSVNRN